MNSMTSAQPAAAGLSMNRIGFATRKPMIVSLYHSGELPRKLEMSARPRAVVCGITRNSLICSGFLCGAADLGQSLTILGGNVRRKRHAAAAGAVHAGFVPARQCSG